MTNDLSKIHLRRNAESRSLSAENPTGEKGKGATISGIMDPNRLDSPKYLILIYMLTCDMISSGYNIS